MQRKIISIVMLVFALFAFMGPAHAFLKKTKKMSVKQAAEFAAEYAKQNPEEVLVALTNITAALKKVKDTNPKKPKTKMGAWYQQFQSMQTLFKLSKDAKNEKDGPKRDRLYKQMANINLDFLAFTVSEKGPKIYADLVPVVTNMAKSVINAYAAQRAATDWLHAVEIETIGRDELRRVLDNEEYAPIGKELRAKGATLQQIADVFKALDALKNAKVKR